MKSFRLRRRIAIAGLALLGLLPAQGSRHAAAAEPLLRPTPLVLKDGRIANVSIHVLPFAAGQAELAAEPAEYLAKLTRTVGTDCFLTAQVIGHIASTEIAGDDTLNAHRLARSRADAVQASLIGGGLPAKAIASVWDWQFMVREPRATLWVFELTAGEDCEGRQLQGDLVAEVSPPSEQGNAAPKRVTKPAVAPAEPPAASSAQPATTAAKPAVTAAKPPGAARTAAAPQPAQSATTPAAQPPVVARAAAAPSAAEAPAPPRAEPGQARQATGNLTETAPAAVPQTMTRVEPAEQPAAAAAQSPATTQPASRPAAAAAQNMAAAQPAKQAATTEAPTPAPVQPAKSATAQPQPPATAQPATAAPQALARAQPAEHTAVGAAPAGTPQPPAKPATDDGKVEHDPAGGLIITFATNSSYFPSGAAARLRDLLAGINGEKRYQVTLQVAVSGTTQVVGAKSADEAARYNKWLAERRVERVQGWLAKNARAEALSIQPEYVANDDSRRLTVRLAPTG